MYCQFLSISLPLYMLQLKSLHVMIEFFLEYLETWALHDRYTITVMVQDILRFYVNSRNFSSQCPLITSRCRNRIFSHYVLVNMLCAYVYIYITTPHGFSDYEINQQLICTDLRQQWQQTLSLCRDEFCEQRYISANFVAFERDISGPQVAKLSKCVPLTCFGFHCAGSAERN